MLTNEEAHVYWNNKHGIKERAFARELREKIMLLIIALVPILFFFPHYFFAPPPKLKKGTMIDILFNVLKN